MLQLSNTTTSQTVISAEYVSGINARLNQLLAWYEQNSLTEQEAALVTASIASYTDILRAARVEPNSSSAVLQLQAVSTDIDLKYRYIAMRQGASNPSPSVEIGVRTKLESSGAERRDLTVGYMLAGYSLADAARRQLFPQLSPVTGARFLPGVYTFFAERGGAVVGSKRLELGFDGNATALVEILVSAE